MKGYTLCVKKIDKWQKCKYFNSSLENSVEALRNSEDTLLFKIAQMTEKSKLNLHNNYKKTYRSNVVSLKTCNTLANTAHLPVPGTVQDCGGEFILGTKGLILRILLASFP